MAQIEKTVFISYRRTDMGWALAVYQHLLAHGYDVFFDFQNIDSGDFEQVIVGNIRARAHFVLLLTRDALARCIEPEDWLRREIETAMAEKRNIVPLMLPGFDFDAPEVAACLTGSLANLRRYSALPVPTAYFDEAMTRLRERFLNVPLEAVLHPLSDDARAYTESSQQEAAQVPTLNAPPAADDAPLSHGTHSAPLNDVDPQPEGFWTGLGKMLGLVPDDAMRLNNRGAAHEQAGDYAAALADFNAALDLKPDFALAYQNRGLVHYRLGDYAAALEDYAHALRLQPNNADIYFNRAATHFEQGNLTAALQDYDQVIRIKPWDASGYLNRGFIHDARGDYARAIADFEQAIRFKPDYAEAYHNRGVTREKLGEVPSALADHAEAARLKPDFADAHNGCAWAHYRLGQDAEARAAVARALALKPDDPHALHTRGMLFLRAGDRAAAEADFRRALAIDPENQDAQAALAEMGL